MLKYQKIIEQLTTEQKISLLTDTAAFSTREINFRGVPKVKFTELFNGGLTADDAACSFEKGVFYELASERLKGVKGGVVMLPSANVRGVFGGKGMSEDPWLISQYLSECVKAVKEHGAIACYSLLSMREEDKALTDDIAENRAIVEYFFLPFKQIKTYEGNAVMCGEDGSDYLPFVNGGNVDYKFICNRSGSEAVKALFDGYLMSIGAFGAIENALVNYRRYAREAKEGELEALCKEGEALSEDMLDGYVDRAIDFATNCATEEPDVSDEENIEKQNEIAKRCIVLLKNSGSILPIKGGKIAVIGADPFDLAAAFRKRMKTVEIKTDFKEGSINAVSGAIADSSLAVLILKGENGVISSEEKKILTLLKDEGVKVIAVLPSGFFGSVRALEQCDAILLSPDPAKFHGALYSVLIGEYSPSGRAACSLYGDVSDEMRSISDFKKEEENRIGPFIGYRRYDEMSSTVRYPFGFGISYAGFGYSDLVLSGRDISFILQNNGKCDGEEVVQIYYGKSDSAVIRPKKELKYCVKVFVQAGKATRVKIRLPARALEVYSRSKLDWIEEGGVYEVYVCSSSNKVKLFGRTNISGVHLESDNKKRYVYSTAKSNVVEEGYVYGVKKKSRFNASQAFTAVLFGLILIFGALILAGVFPESENWKTLIGLIVISFSAPVFILMIILAIRGSSDEKAVREPDVTVRRRMYNSRLSQMFEEAFYDDTSQSAQTVSDEVAFTEEEEDKVSEILEETDMTDLIGKLVAASKARGIEVSDSDAREFIASMAAARLIIVKDSDLIFEFGNAVADAFGGKHFYEADAFSRSTDLITNEKSIDLRPTEDALLTSAAHPERVYILTLAPSVKERFEILKPFGDYFSYPKGRDRIKFATADGEKTCQLSSGVWVITTIDDMLFDEIPSYISKNAVFSSLTLTAAEESKGKIECPVILPEQFENSVASLSKRSSLSEENWKKIDEFLDYASSLVDFSLGNRGFLALERYFSIMLENGNDETSALDLAVAHALLPRFISAVRESSAIVEENILDVLERIFGENDVSACEEVIGRSLMLGIKGAGRLGDE